MSQKTTTVIFHGLRASAYAERVATHAGDRIAVRVYDDIARHYTECHSLRPGQVRRIISRTLARE